MAAAMVKLLIILYFSVLFLAITLKEANGAVDPETQALINSANLYGPYLGVVIPNLFEMIPLLQHPSFNARPLIIDHAGN